MLMLENWKLPLNQPCCRAHKMMTFATAGYRYVQADAIALPPSGSDCTCCLAMNEFEVTGSHVFFPRYVWVEVYHVEELVDIPCGDRVLCGQL